MARKLVIIPAIVLAATLTTPSTIDEKIRHCADFGIPSIEKVNPSLVTDDYNRKPTTTKVYNIGGVRIETSGHANIVYSIKVKNPSSEQAGLYWYFNGHCDKQPQ